MNPESGDNKEEKPPKQAFLGDLTDGREPGNWKTRYDVEASDLINWEKKYLLWILGISLVLPFLIGAISQYYFPDASQFINCKKYLFSFFGGILGGTLFSMKWLVHSVAKNTWNQDRRLWRIFTPWLSGSLALGVMILVNGGIFKLAEPANLTIHKCYGVGFLVGYFSDNAIGKLTEIAQVFFGSTLSQKR